MAELKDINLHQTALIQDLDMIEGELDSFINGQVGSAETSKFLTKIYNQPTPSEHQSQRERVLTQTLTLEKEIAGLSDSLQKCESMMNKQNDNYKSAAE